MKSDPLPPRMFVEVDVNLKKVDLLISSAALSDSALYYCEVSTQNIKPLERIKHVSEGDPVTLSCSFSMIGGDYLPWYRQYPSSRPEFLLFNNDPILSRITAEVIKAKDEMDLLISSAAVSDSALYYSALEPTVTGIPLSLYKNLLLHRQD
uniref:Immunoglobulin V-set domain-containing protein n=1 Tax=Electrophorus electricus TaxID=8005 RepID=A0AAY5ER26_ELEEL